MTDREISPYDLQDWAEMDARPTACRCGPDLPGRCPGPANCPLEQTAPECRVCNHETTHRQDADDTWICADCEDLER